MGPEAQFWSTIRKNLPSGAVATRIENRAGGGIPDVYILWNGLSFWIELKVNKKSQVKVSPHQIAWHASHHARGGLSFFLVKDLSSGLLHLFSGEMGSDLLGKPISEVRGSSFKRVSEVFEALRPRLLAHYERAVAGFSV